MDEFNWVCPHCQHAQTVLSSKHSQTLHKVDVGETVHGVMAVRLRSISCSNPNCKEVTAVVELVAGRQWLPNGNLHEAKTISVHKIRPESSAKPLPVYIPKAIVADYTEASRIRDLSPKASATLSRRCIQGMIRDFCNISEKSLFVEISELTKRLSAGTAPAGVNAESIEAIDHVRTIGNIGAHMEKDINIIIDVDPGEAQALLDLIELLFEEWYVARSSRQMKLAKIKTIAAEKAEAKKTEVRSDDAGSAV